MTPVDLAAHLRRYVSERARMRQTDPEEIHGLHIGDEREVVLRGSDLEQAAALLEAQSSALKGAGEALRGLLGELTADDELATEFEAAVKRSGRSPVNLRGAVRKARSVLSTITNMDAEQ